MNRITFALWLLPLLGTPAAASVEIAEKEGRFELHAANDTPRAVMSALAERFEFKVIFPDEKWGRDPRDYERRGTIDELLEYVCAGNNFITKYWRPEGNAEPEVIQVEIIQPMESTRQIAAPITFDEAPPEPLPDSIYADEDHAAAYADVDIEAGYDAPVPDHADDDNHKAQNRQASRTGGAVRSASAERASVSDMLRSHAQASAASESVPAAAPAAATTSLEQEAQLRVLTQRAHAEVKDLAKALRQAEAAMKP